MSRAGCAADASSPDAEGIDLTSALDPTDTEGPHGDADVGDKLDEPCGLARVDTVTGAVVDANIQLPGCDTPVGVSVDVDGLVWVPDQGANLAFRFDPIGGGIQTTEGLVRPYTYSDMTGAGLQLVTFPPQG